MEDAIFACPEIWERWVSPETRKLRKTEELSGQRWGVLLLPLETIPRIHALPIACECLLVEGVCHSESLACVQAKHIVTYGLSSRDSLTLSSLQNPVLCIQRVLHRLDGTVIEPQEIPLADLPLPAEQLLPLLGLRLLQMPLTKQIFL